MEVRVLGTVHVRAASGGSWPLSPQLRGLLAVLALDAGSVVSTTRLAESVWGEDLPSPNAMQVAMSKLRRLLADMGEPDRLVGHPAGYVLEVSPEMVDALRFERLIDEARSLRPDWPMAAELLEGALDLWVGDPLGGVADSLPMLAERTRLEELRRLAEEDLAEARLECGDHLRVVPEVEALVVAEPLRERRWVLLLRALYGSGRQAEALTAYNRARTTLIEAVGAEPGPELREVYEAVLAQAASLPASGSATSAPVGASFRRRGNVRHPLDRCIGRSDDLAAIGALLDHHRLVTIVGPGGVGKTRVAMEISAGRVDVTPDGVWWVNLAPARGGDDVVRAVQRVLDLGDDGYEGQHLLDGVCAALTNRSILLVLDNCEHLLDDLAPTMSELLARCADVRILATSREAVRVAGESVFLLSPLDPAGAAELFQARVAVPIDGDAEASGVVREIVRRLDGLPLALELAAARAQHLRLDELLDRLAHPLDVLDAGRRDAPARQRDLESVADWSYQLLGGPEQLVFERLSVFSDGATLDAARSVCSVGPVSAADVEGLLRRLVDKSLVVADRSGPVTRYRMLQTIADFAAARLKARGQADEAARAHVEWVRELARSVRWGVPVRGAAVAAIHDEDAAVRDAIGWAVSGDPTVAVEICDHLAPYWFGAMRVSGGWDLMRSAVRAAEDLDTAQRCSLLAWAVVFATLVQETDLADAFAAEAEQYEVRRGDRERLGRLCLLRALAAGYRSDGDLDRWVEQARHHLDVGNVDVGVGLLLFAEGAGLLVAGDLQVAADRLERAVAAFQQIDDHLGLILAVSRLGELAWRLDDVDLFADTHAQLLELGQASRTQGVVVGATARLALARLLQGQDEVAERMARRALEGCGGTFMPVINGYAFRTAALVDLHAGHVAAGRRELAAAIEAFEGGAGSVGVGQAALCWIDLSRSLRSSGDHTAAFLAAEAAQRAARSTNDPWVCERADAHARSLGIATS